MLKWLIKLLGHKPKGLGEGELHYTDIIEAYREAFHMNWWSYLIALVTGVFKLENEWYKPVDEELIHLILDADMGDREEWELDFYDCGAFTFNLMGVFHQNRETAAMPIYITWVNTGEGGHAVLSYCWDGDVYIIEPQNDDVYFVFKDWRLMLQCG